MECIRDYMVHTIVLLDIVIIQVLLVLLNSKSGIKIFINDIVPTIAH